MADLLNHTLDELVVMRGLYDTLPVHSQVDPGFRAANAFTLVDRLRKQIDNLIESYDATP